MERIVDTVFGLDRIGTRQHAARVGGASAVIVGKIILERRRRLF